MSVNVRELTPEEIHTIFPLIKQLNPTMEEHLFHKRLEVMLEKGYRCAAAFDDAGHMMGLSGFWVLCRFWCGEHVDMDNVIIDERFRGQGVGKKLMEWIENWARARGITFAVLDAYAENAPAHQFYFRQGYIIRGFHFTKEL